MKIELKIIPYGSDSKKINEFQTVIQADNWEKVCGELVRAINQDTIDTENNMLVSVVTD